MSPSPERAMSAWLSTDTTSRLSRTVLGMRRPMTTISLPPPPGIEMSTGSSSGGASAAGAGSGACGVAGWARAGAANATIMVVESRSGSLLVIILSPVEMRWPAAAKVAPPAPALTGSALTGSARGLRCRRWHRCQCRRSNRHTRCQLRCGTRQQRWFHRRTCRCR